MEWIKTNIWEVKQSTSLKLFGVLLGFCHVLNYFSWGAQVKSLPFTDILCWPFLPQCTQIGLFSASIVDLALLGLLVCGTLAILFFSLDRFESLGQFFLAVAFGLHILVYLARFNLFNNAQTLLLFIEFFFLFVPQKARLIKWTLLAGYLVEGYLKFDPSWMGGFWFADRLAWPTKANEWLAALAIVFELVVAWGLFFKGRDRFWIFFLAMVTYHGFMMSLGLTNESSIRLVLLCFFVLSYLERVRLEREYLYQSYIRPEPSKIWIGAGLSLFLFFQILPVTSSEVRMHKLPLTMQKRQYEQKCQQFNYVISKAAMRSVSLEVDKKIPKMFKCNAAIHFRMTKAECKELQKNKDFVGLSTFFLVQKPGEKNPRSVFEYKNICNKAFTPQKKSGGA